MTIYTIASRQRLTYRRIKSRSSVLNIPGLAVNGAGNSIAADSTDGQRENIVGLIDELENIENQR